MSSVYKYKIEHGNMINILLYNINFCIFCIEEKHQSIQFFNILEGQIVSGKGVLLSLEICFKYYFYFCSRSLVNMIIISEIIIVFGHFVLLCSNQNLAFCTHT